MVSDKKKHDIFCAELGRQDCFLLSQKLVAQPPIFKGEVL